MGAAVERHLHVFMASGPVVLFAIARKDLKYELAKLH